MAPHLTHMWPSRAMACRRRAFHSGVRYRERDWPSTSAVRDPAMRGPFGRSGGERVK